MTIIEKLNIIAEMGLLGGAFREDESAEFTITDAMYELLENYCWGKTHTYYDDATNRLETLEISKETDPDGDGATDEDPDDTTHELYEKHVKYYYKKIHCRQTPKLPAGKAKKTKRKKSKLKMPANAS